MSETLVVQVPRLHHTVLPMGSVILYRISPAVPVGPVGPVEPVGPVGPVEPVVPVGPPPAREASSDAPLGPYSTSTAETVPQGTLRLPGSDEFRLEPKKTAQLVVLTMPTPAPEA